MLCEELFLSLNGTGYPIYIDIFGRDLTTTQTYWQIISTHKSYRVVLPRYRAEGGFEVRII